jgi:hypothetical protein
LDDCLVAYGIKGPPLASESSSQSSQRSPSSQKAESEQAEESPTSESFETVESVERQNPGGEEDYKVAPDPLTEAEEVVWED